MSRRLSPKTIRNIVGVLKMILGEKVWRDWNLTMPKEEVREQRWFTPSEMSQIINATTGQWKVLFATLAGTGMRCGEAFGLHVEDVDLAKGKITIRTGSGSNVGRPPRGSQERSGFCDSLGYAILQGQCETQAESDSEQAESAASGPARISAWPRFHAPGQWRAGRIGQGLGRPF